MIQLDNEASTIADSGHRHTPARSRWETPELTVLSIPGQTQLGILLGQDGAFFSSPSFS